MGRKKKPFIDKKKAVKFHLVPRSQADPLLGDSQQPQHVLKPEEPLAEAQDSRLVQQQLYGISYSDDYDYLQHIKASGTALLEPAMAPGKKSSLGLPGSLFGSEVEVEGDMGKVLPITGPQPNWDPDIVAALDNPDMNFDLDDQLEDDFILQANGGEPGIPVYVTDSGSKEVDVGEEGDMWWMGRGDFSAPRGHTDQSGSTETDQSDADSMKVVEGEDGEVRSKVIPNWSPPEERVGQFTNYSISSSVVPRNKGLTQLDDRFEKFMTEYDDAELGVPEVEGEGGEGEGGGGEGGEKWLLDLAVKDFEKNFADKVQISVETSESEMRAEEEERLQSVRERRSSGGPDESESEEEEEEEEGGDWGGREGKEVVMVAVKEGDWDCESILSTYSNLYNHPTKIVEHSSSQPEASHVQLSRKTGIPLGTITGPLTKEKPLKQMPVTRLRSESAEERRARKNAVKEERKLRRSEKKATKELFHSEQLRQQKLNFSQTHTAAVV